MFFNKPIKEIKFNDVLSFCELKTKENFALDYKEEFPKNLEKTIASFANTYGGLIIIGVEENDGKPVDKPKGIKWERGLEERVYSITTSNITPPIFPEVQVCDPVKDKTFVIIQIPQSTNTPHAIENNTKVYSRTGNISTPEELININELHWLARHRENAINLRNENINSVNDRYYSLIEYGKVNIEFGELNMYIIPAYPTYLNVDLLKLKNEITSLEVNTLGNSVFPSFMNTSIKIMQNGLYLFIHNKGDLGEFTEYTAFNTSGLLFHSQDFGRIKKGNDDLPKKTVYLSQIVAQYFDFLHFYKNFANQINIHGDYKIHVALLKMFKVLPVYIGYNNFWGEDPEPFMDKRYIYDRILTTEVFNSKESIINEVADFAVDLQLGLGFPYTKDQAIKWLEEKSQNINF